MIHTAPFLTPAAVAEFFNAPANATLRLVSVLPADAPARGFTALYETPPDPLAELEEERLRHLEEKALALIALDDKRKAKANFPRGVIEDSLSAPLAIVSNRLGQLAAFQDMTNAERARWVEANAPAVGFRYIGKDEAKEQYGCASELLRLEE